MMLWVWGLPVVETNPWGPSPVPGVALAEVKGVERALGADRAQTERAVNPKGQIAERLLQLYSRLYPEPIWTRGFCQTPDGDKLP